MHVRGEKERIEREIPGTFFHHSLPPFTFFFFFLFFFFAKLVQSRLKELSFRVVELLIPYRKKMINAVHFRCSISY